jgi:hypothetical protein
LPARRKRQIAGQSHPSGHRWIERTWSRISSGSAAASMSPGRGIMVRCDVLRLRIFPARDNAAATRRQQR